MRRKHILKGIIWVLLFAVPFVSHGQNGSFESLWAVHETIPHHHPSLWIAQLDTIEHKAVREKNAYQHFRVNWERIYLDNRTDRVSFKEMLLRIDSLRKMEIAVQWNDPDSALYRALYHYLSGMVLMTASGSANTTSSNTQNSDIRRLEEWTKEDFRNAAKEHFRTCFDQMPTEIEYSNSVWGFLTTDDAVWTVFTPTLYDVLVQNCLDYFYKDKEMVEYLIEKVLNIPPLKNDQTVKIHFELLWLAHLYDLPDYPVDSSEYWKELDWLEKIYDPNEAFDYTRGVLLYSASQQTEEKNDYPARALNYFDHVMREGEIAYYRQNSSYYIERLTLPQIELTNAQYDLPLGHKLRIPITYANIDTLYVSVYRDDHDSRASYLGYNFKNGVNKQINGTYSTQWYSDSEEPIYTQRFILETHGKNLSYTTELWLDSLPQGHYDLFFHQRPKLDSLGALMKTAFSVNRMKVSAWTEGHNHFVAVNDFHTGKPISGRSVNVPLKMTRFTNRFGEIRYQRILCWGEGLIKIHDKNVKYEYYNRQDDYPWLWNNTVSKRYYRRSMGNYFSRLFTDRTLYRPGQTVHFKFVLYSGKGKLIPNQTVDVQLQEDKYPYAIIDSIQLTTNEFGSVAGEFKMPDKIGKYRIELECSDKRVERWYNPTIEVAEYKLPSFKVKLLKDTAQTATGDTLTIRGKVTALSGYPISDANVALNVNYIETEQFNLYTDEDGYFTYRYAVPRSGVDVVLYIEAIVTDLNGETHQDNMRVVIPPKLLTISVDLEEDFDLATGDTMQLVLQPVNFEKIGQPVPLRVTIMRLKSPENYRIPVLEQKPQRWEPHYSQEEYARQFPHVTWDLNERSYSYWPVLETVYTTERLFCPDSLLLLDVHNWKTGDYTLLVEGTDKRGNPVKEERHFTVNNSSSTDFNAFMPIRIAIKDYPERTGEKMTLSVGSYLHDAVMICDVYQGGKRLKTLRIPLDREQKLVTVKTRRNNDRYIKVLARIVQNGEIHHKNINYLISLDPKTRESIIRYLQENTLTAELTHYHNVAEPGSNEEWEITIQDGNKNAAKEVEMLAWMMDGSLYELGMKEPNYKLNPRYRSSIPRAFRKKMTTTILRSECKDLSVAYPSYITFRQAKRRYLPGPYEKIRPLYNYASMYYPEAFSGELHEVVVTYEPPVFSMDNTTSSGRDVRSALSDMAGVSSVDGTMTSVRGNRSDGEQVIVDGMQVRRDVQVVETIIEEETPEVKEIPAPSHDIRVRTTFTETAFFYPQLRTDEQGRIKFRFTLPDQYTNWQFFATGHDKRLSTCELTTFLQSRRTLMLQTNAPRFLREGDTMDFATKVVNTGNTAVHGNMTLEFFNAEDDQPIKIIVGNDSQPFDVSANASQEVHFRLAIPENVPAVTYRIVAHCTDSAAVAGDGEENILPVLPNRMLVTEAQHFVVPARTDTAFTFQRYHTAQTPTLRPLSYTMEVTANPTWLAIQALPSLMRYPYECNEQLFSKLFAAAVVRHALQQNPELEDIFERWRNDTLNGSLESPLLKNETLRNILLEETPWLSSAQSESKQRRENAELFSADNLDRQLTQNLNKLMRNQLPGGGWDWYGRYGYSRYITDYLIAGFYKLQRLGVELSADADKMLAKAIRQSDKAQEERYQQYLERLNKNPEAKFYFSEEDVHYLYARSFAGFDSVWLKKSYVQNLINLSAHQIYTAPYMRQAEFALAMHHLGETEVAKQIVEDLRYYAFQDKDLGMYWGESPSNRRRDWRIWGYYPWHEAPVERQAMLIEAFAEISPREEELTAMKQWLLLQKEGNSWKSTKASSAAVYALLLNAPKELLAPATTTITVGGETFTPAQDENAEAGTGYLKHVWTAEAMTLQLADISIHTDSVHPAFGSCYWQYLEIPDRVTASGDGLTIRRTLLHRPAEGDGKHSEPVTEENPLRIGERITVRLVISNDRDLEYVHVKDPRTAAFEPVNIHERRGSNQGVWWVETPRDAAEHFFLNRLPQGTIIIEYDLYVTQTGTFSHAPATIECMYAPGHRGQSDGNRITIR